MKIFSMREGTHHSLLFLISETDRDDEEGIEQQSDISKTEEGAPESDNGDVKEIEKSKEDSEEKIQFGAKNRMRQRLTRNSALC